LAPNTPKASSSTKTNRV
jgi:hypothetical protein